MISLIRQTVTNKSEELAMARKAAVGGRRNYKKVTSQTVHENNKVIKTTNSYFC